MNYENLHTLISLYEQNLYMLNGTEHNEKFKWRAVKGFQDIWFSDNASTIPFSELFRNAKKQSSILVDNNTVSPANGVVKLAEKAPEEVEHLFRDVLFAEDDGDLNLRQNHMDEFLEGMEALLQRYFPANWKYRQDRHSASCYLAMYAPEKNFIYKHNPVERFAIYVEYGKDIGAGTSFKLENYYELGEIIVAALREHPSLLEAHDKLLDESHYKDESLHLLAFDIIYCANTYGFFRDLDHRPKREVVKAYSEEQRQRKQEAAHQHAVSALEEEIHKIEALIEEYSSISLVGLRVTQKIYGSGIVVHQDVNHIRVSFPSGEKNFIISSKFPMRPRFDDDEDIVAAMTDYEEKTKLLMSLKKQLSKL